MRQLILMTFLICSQLLSAQTAQEYQNEKGQTHLCGPISLEDLRGPICKEWFEKSYNAYTVPEGKHKWKKHLKQTQVDIYLGTWCGDTKRWVPRFVKAWESLGLSTEQLNFIALYDGEDRYKQGPNGEEKGKDIHRVPTFIFQRAGVEFARIVESPRSDLLTDLAQIALGYPPAPNYRAASYMQNLIAKESRENIYKDLRKYVNEAYRLAGKSSELNTLGYVLLRAGQTSDALTVFQFNTYFHPYTPNVFDSFAEALEISGDKENAIAYYKKVLELDKDHEHAKTQLEALESGR